MKAKLKILALLLMFANIVLFGNTKTDSLLSVLDKAIENRPLYLKQKQEHIATLKNIINKSPQMQYSMKDELYNELYNEYRTFNYDSAFTYSIKLLHNAYSTKDKVIVDKSRIKVSFILLSAGLFKESLDTLHKISVKNLPDSVKLEYYSVLARTYFDMADYSSDLYFTPQYSKKGMQMLDSALLLCAENSKAYLSQYGLKYLRNGEVKKARSCYEKLLKMPELDGHQYAIEASSLSFVYKFDNESDLALQMLIRAAIADIEVSTKETVAIRQLAEILYKNNDVERAYTYVKVALDDANFYGARHRKVQVSDILPSIEDRQLEIVKTQRRTFLIYSISATLLSLLIITFIIIIFRQLKSLKKAKQYLSEANKRLSGMNKKLLEANRIKEEYIGHFFDTISGYIGRFEKLKLNISRKVTTHQIDDIKDIISTIDIKKEREEFYNNFDSTFLNIFPNFVESFNSFLKEDHLGIEPEQLLTPEVRIYALIRLGISDNDKIARFLGYSLNTIYAYKTKIKNKLNISSEEFDKRLMKIEAV